MRSEKTSARKTKAENTQTKVVHESRAKRKTVRTEEQPKFADYERGARSQKAKYQKESNSRKKVASKPKAAKPASRKKR